MTNTMRADALHEAAVAAPVQRSILQLVVARVVDTAELSRAFLRTMGLQHGLADLDAEYRLRRVDVADQIPVVFNHQTSSRHFVGSLSNTEGSPVEVV